MKLYRYVLAYFGRKLKQPWTKTANVGDVIVSIGKPEVEGNCPERRLVTASVDLATLPCVDDASRILVPKEDREKCEDSALHAINLISVLESCSKQIFSPVSCVAFGSDEPREREFLENSHGIFANESKSDSAVGWTIEFTSEIATAIADRFDGVALLSEALSSDVEGHRYREFVRFLELAFGISFYERRLAKKLTQFLSSGPGGYNRDEIDEWVNLRHPAMHGDYAKMDWIAISANVRQIALRMQQACLDVLFNKEKWRDSSKTRRQVWRPDAISTSKTGKVVAKYATPLSLLIRVLDEFGVHPVKLGITVDHSNDHLYATYWRPNQPTD
ncbi:hypothetical protein [Candidatus Nitrospira salsa]